MTKRRLIGRTAVSISATGALMCALAASGGSAVAVEPPYKASDYHRTGGDVGKPITPMEVAFRGNHWTSKAVPYSQSAYEGDPEGKQYRTDCSGFVSMAWHLNDSANTDSIRDAAPAHDISWNEVGPGDAVNITKAEGAALGMSDGHIRLIVHRYPDGSLRTMEEHGGDGGQADEFVGTYSINSLRADGYRPIRYDKLIAISDEDVRKAMKKFTPHPEPIIQPVNHRSLVKPFRTIFYVDGKPFDEVHELTSQNIKVRLYAEQVKWEWHWGNGESDESEDAGKPYPNETVWYEYVKPDHYEPSVDVTYSRYRFMIVDPRFPNDGWHDVTGENLNIGPTTDLDVVEQWNVLGGDGDN